MTIRQTLLKLQKMEGETPLQCLDRFRLANPEYKDATLSYVGRLDPMAEGLLLVVVDEENKKRQEYLHLDKTYEVEILLGIKTDTGDVLGKIINVSPFAENGILDFPGITEMTEKIQSLIGEITLPYPFYSSKPVNGKSLFQWAREERLDEIEIPTKTTQIYSIELKKEYELSKNDLLQLITKRVEMVNGDFRQKEIIDSWKNSLAPMEEKIFPVIAIEVNCSSGTYMRMLSEKIGGLLDADAIAWKIKRTKVGKHIL